jgi:DNA modification methylase
MKLSDLKPADYNPRKISDKQLEMLRKSLDEFGDLSGIVFNRRTGNVIGGHQRLKCLPPDAKIEKKDLKERSKTGTVAEGWIVIDGEKFVYREVDWDEATEKMANIAANKHGGEWDDEKLGQLLQELSELPVFDLDLVGFESSELDAILSQIEGTGLIDDDEVPEVETPEPITKTGDLYILGGKHRVLCGDATKKEDIERLMDGKKADMVFTDPPYGVSYSDKNKFLNAIDKGNCIQKPIENDHKAVDDLKDNIIFPSFCNIKLFLKDNGTYYITAPQGGDLLLMMMMMMDKSGLPLRHMLIWVKNNHVLGRTDYNYKHEPILYGWINKHTFYGNGKYLFSTWEIPKPNKSDLHPTMKPVELIENAILNSTLINHLVFDPFLGSGSTLIACEKTNRICYGMEIDPHYVDVIVTRYCKFTGNSKIIKNGEEIDWDEAIKKA